MSKPMGKPRILVILGSTRPNRASEKIAEWVKDQVVDNSEMDFEFVDLRDWNFGFYNEPVPGMAIQKYSEPKGQDWADKVASADGYLLLVPEYNHGYSAVLKNALDLTFYGWNRKPVAFVSWGVASGVRAVEQLKQVVVQLLMAPLNQAVEIPLFGGGLAEDGKPTGHYNGKLKDTLDNLAWWTKALKSAREQEVEVAEVESAAEAAKA